MNGRLRVAYVMSRFPKLTETLAVLRCGVDTTFFTPASSEDRSRGDGHELAVACIGNLHEVKWQVHLIDAAGLLRDEGLRVRVRFVGGGPDRHALERRVTELQLDDRIEFLGERPRAEVAALLAASDVLVAPSVPTSSGKREGLPVVLPEAMSAGVAVVASDLSGIPEIVVHGETGLTTRAGDARAIADALRRLCEDPALRVRLGAAGRERVLRDFDGDRNGALLARWFRAGSVA